MMASPFSAIDTAPFDLAGDGNAHGARDDDDVAGRRAVLQHQPAQLVARIVEQFGRAHRAGDDDGILAAAMLASISGPRPSAGAAAGWRGRRNRSSARADRDRSCAACARACRSAPSRPRLPRSGRCGPPLPAGAPSRGRWRTCGRLRAPRDARPRRRRRGATACRRSTAAASPARSRAGGPPPRCPR